VVFCLFAAGAFLGEAVEALFLEAPEAGRLLVPVVTRLGPVEAVDGAARFFPPVFVVFLAADALALGAFLVLGLVDFLAAARLVDGTFFLWEEAAGDFAFFWRAFNSFLPSSAIL